MSAVPVVENAMEQKSGQSAGDRAADHVPSAGVRTAGPRAAVQSRGRSPLSVRSTAHRVSVVRVLRALGPVLLRHVRDAHVPSQPLVPEEQGRQFTGVTAVFGARLDRHVLGRLSVRLAD